MWETSSTISTPNISYCVSEDLKKAIKNGFKEAVEEMKEKEKTTWAVENKKSSKKTTLQNPSTKIRCITVNEKKRIITVVFEDGKVRMSKCTEEDTFDVNVGVAMCIAYQLFNGSKNKFKKEVSSKAKTIKK